MMTDNQPDQRVIACNYVIPTKICSQGSLCYVGNVVDLSPKSSRLMILCRSRSGRWVHKWENAKHLGNFRLKTLPAEHPLYSDYRIQGFNAESLLMAIQTAMGL